MRGGRDRGKGSGSKGARGKWSEGQGARDEGSNGQGGKGAVNLLLITTI